MYRTVDNNRSKHFRVYNEINVIKSSLVSLVTSEAIISIPSPLLFEAHIKPPW